MWKRSVCPFQIDSLQIMLVALEKRLTLSQIMPFFCFCSYFLIIFRLSAKSYSFLDPRKFGKMIISIVWPFVCAVCSLLLVSFKLAFLVTIFANFDCLDPSWPREDGPFKDHCSQKKMISLLIKAWLAMIISIHFLNYISFQIFQKKMSKRIDYAERTIEINC